MRRIFIALCLALASLGAMAQQVVYDQVNSGVRQTICSSILITPSDSHELITVALAGFETQGIRRYSLATSIHADHKFSIADNAAIVITLGNGKMQVLPGAKGGESILRSVDIYADKVDELTTRYNYYTITKKQIKEIKKRGISAITVEIGNNVTTSANMGAVANLITSSWDMLEGVLKGSRTR